MTSGAADFRRLLEAGGVSGGVEKIADYLVLLERWSATHSLVRFSSREDLVRRHVLESLAALPFMDARGSLLDVGSGAGLPGVPILAALPGWRGHLLEPRSKRWAFLRTVIRELDLRADVTAARYQDVGADLAGFDLISARALGGYSELAGWARSRLAPGGQMLIWTGSGADEALARLPGWDVLSCALSCAGRGRLVRLRPCFT